MAQELIAHLRESDRQTQSLWEHLQETSDLAAGFAGKIGLEDVGRALGLLHDLGKASQEFQIYLGSAEGLISPDNDSYVDADRLRGMVDHSSAGAQTAFNHLSPQGSAGRIAGQILAICLASHHSGLIDCLTPAGEDAFSRRMAKSEERAHTGEALSSLEPRQVEALNRLLGDSLATTLLHKLAGLKEAIDTQDSLAFKQGLLIRFLYSCLIDADRLSTADFETPQNQNIRNYGSYLAWDLLIRRLEDHLADLERRSSDTPVNAIRRQVSQACLEAAPLDTGIFQLTVPTGGGKTLASLRFALHHAAHHHLERVIYVIPYTSIIDQNADEVRKILEERDPNGRPMDQVVLEHHSNLTPDEESRRQSLLAENWDAPVIFTTQVQFLEACFGGGTRSARRMHQLANAVIIFDEVQTLPVRCVHLFNLALRFLTHTCGSSVVLCTATQPLLDRVEPPSRALPIQPGRRLIADEESLFRALKRVELVDRRKPGGWSDAETADLVEQELSEIGSVLVIVNTKKSARTLYHALHAGSGAPVFHLSTNMCPAHRLDTLQRVRGRLANQEPVICVSTQLIEAGVDIDFGAVIRYLAGFDSLVQAAGRCNRHGARKTGRVWIVNPSEQNVGPLKDVQIGMEIAQRILDEFKGDPAVFNEDLIGPAALGAYFQYYFYNRKGEMDYPVSASSPVGRQDNLFNLLSVNTLSCAEYQRTQRTPPTIPFKQSFHAAAQAFAVIDTPTRGVVVPYGVEGKEIINDLCSVYALEKQYRLLKRAQRYSVNLLPHEIQKLTDQGAIHVAQENSEVMYLKPEYYSEEFGWQTEPIQGANLLITEGGQHG